MASIWLVVADNSRARFFSMENHSAPIQEIKDIVHTESRLRETQITSDLPGRASSTSGGTGHAYDDETSPREQESINFAKTIAHELDAARKAHKFKEIALVAPPRFLGHLREQLNTHTLGLICFELPKDLSLLEAPEIRQHLPARLPGPGDL